MLSSDMILSYLNEMKDNLEEGALLVIGDFTFNCQGAAQSFHCTIAVLLSTHMYITTNKKTESSMEITSSFHMILLQCNALL